LERNIGLDNRRVFIAREIASIGVSRSTCNSIYELPIINLSSPYFLAFVAF